MTDTSAFTVLTNGITAGDSEEAIQSFLAGDTIAAGMLVAIAAAGTSNTVVPAVATAVATAHQAPVGVALFAAVSGDVVSVITSGLCTMLNADDTTVIDAGDSVIWNDNAIGGTVSSGTGLSGAPTAGDGWVIGKAKNDIAGGASGLIQLNMYYMPA